MNIIKSKPGHHTKFLRCYIEILKNMIFNYFYFGNNTCEIQSNLSRWKDMNKENSPAKSIYVYLSFISIIKKVN